MAKKENKKNKKNKAKGGIANGNTSAMGMQTFSGGIPPMGNTFPGGNQQMGNTFPGNTQPMGTQAFSGGIPPMGTQAFSTGVPNIPPTATPLDRSQITAEQMTQMQLEEAIKESQDPASKLKKLRSPIRPRSCLLNLLFLILLTFGLLFFVVYFLVDQFNFGTIFMDMLQKFGIIDLWNTITSWVSGLFSGGKAAAAVIGF